MQMCMWIIIVLTTYHLTYPVLLFIAIFSQWRKNQRDSVFIQFLFLKKVKRKNTLCFGNQKGVVLTWQSKEPLSMPTPVRPHTAWFKVVVVEQESSISDLLSTCQVNDVVPLLWLWSCILLLELYASKCSAVQHPKLSSLTGASVNFKSTTLTGAALALLCNANKRKKSN